MVSRIPGSIPICEGNVAGDSGSSWTVPIFVLNRFLFLPVDEDLIPPNGNPHHANGHFLNEENPMPGFFEDVGDLQ
jgi:hypothetical protein